MGLGWRLVSGLWVGDETRVVSGLGVGLGVGKSWGEIRG